VNRPPAIRIHSDDLIVDSFAGGGGASLGIEWALGRSPDIAINHDPEAIAMHSANHPATRHFCESVWDVDPVKACGGRRVALAWFSPDCKHFSKAKGGKPVDKKIRGLAWIVIRWAKAVKPRVICLENVQEFQEWGPLLEDNMPCRERRGLTFRRWVKQLENLGYQVEWRELRACDYGVPTMRKRLFLVARCDGLPIVWPEPTHGPGLEPFLTAADCIDFSLLCPSIFDRKRSLAENTMRRIARGTRRYVIEAANPFIVQYHSPKRAGDDRVRSLDHPLPTQTVENRFGLVAATLINTRNGERLGQQPRVRDVRDPFPTVTAAGSQGALVTAMLARHYGGHENDGAPLQLPIPTITAKDHHALVTSHLVKFKGTCRDGQPVTDPIHTIQAGGYHYGEVRAFLLKYYGTDQNPQLDMPLGTLTTKDRFALVLVRGQLYAIADIGMRMLVPRELFTAHGFPPGYIIRPLVNGKPMTQTAQVRMVGNSVPPGMAAAVARAQFLELEAVA